jgi:hypothetical protein
MREEEAVTDLPEVAAMQVRLQQARSLPDMLAVSFDAFEVIRVLARQYQDQIPPLFATFMSTADAAVDGREAITIAPSLPPPSTQTERLTGPYADTELDEVTTALAALGALLADRLTRAAAIATTPGDRLACEEAAAAAQRISQLMAHGEDASRLR